MSQTAGSARRNALADETSPYLRQHAENPVEWHPWSEDVIERARLEDKPILLSVGYSACHWCHVMAHESFEDEETARVMNEHFVNIKVDREERPDLDKIYQIAHQLLTRRGGGWPLTVFLTPDDLAPFFAGTYFPREPRFGMPAFRDLLVQIASLYRERRDDIRRQNDSLVRALHSLEPAGGRSASITPNPLADARAALEASFDDREGGFGQAPKFPQPTNLEFLMRRYAQSVAARREDDRGDVRGDVRGDDQALAMALYTLRKMALGGIFDQIGGGFCRYSVDDHWMIPHFEKMLYDNGPLLALCAQAWQITAEPLFERVAHETAGWVLREMQSPEGGYYSSLDADSEGEEGKYYVWIPGELRELLSRPEYDVVAARFGLEGPANFEGRHWHLHVRADEEEIAREQGIDAHEVSRLLASAREKLFAAREQRVPPGRDDKTLSAWNGLMIRGMAIAGRVLGEPRYLDSAGRALDFVRSTLWRDGRLLATAKDGRAHLAAYLDDYAFLAEGALALAEARWSARSLDFATALADVLLEHFEDREAGGFYFTADDHERLLHRSKPMTDDALPSGNGVAALVLGRLGHLLGETRYLEAAERTLRLGWAALDRVPHAHTALLIAGEEHLDPPVSVVLRGAPEVLAPWKARCDARYAPRRLVLAIPADEPELPGLLAERTPRGDAVAYLCEGQTCGEPITTLEALDEALQASEA